MANRKLPFGYCMRGGQICVAGEEAEVIQIIFASYGAGNSYETLAEWLNDRGIPYSPEKKWNKNAVARILQDVRYLGDAIHPPIIAAEVFRGRKPTVSGRLNLPQIKDIRVLAHCAMCGNTVRRERMDTWRCPHCMTSAVKITDKQFIDSVAGLLQDLWIHPNTVVVPPIDEIEDGGISTAKSDFTQELERTEFNESTSKAKAISLASARFDALGSEDYETMRIQYILARTEQSDGLDTALLRQITSAILIDPAGSVSLKLKNGQITKRSELT